jgi:type II secretion system protein H
VDGHGTAGRTVFVCATRRAPGTGRSGFSMVELMVVVAILGLIASIVTVSWEAILPRESLSAEVRRLSNMIQTARSEAISRSAEYQVVYDLGSREYWILPPFGKEGNYEPDPEQREPLMRHQLAEDLRFYSIEIDGDEFSGDEQVFVRFDAVGSSNAHTVVLEQRAEIPVQSTIEVLPLTGLIRFHEGIFEREVLDDGDFDS